MSTAAALSIVLDRDPLAGKSSSSDQTSRGVRGGGSLDYESRLPPWEGLTEQSNQATGVTPIETHSDWLPIAFKRLVGFSSLAGNWDSYGAEPPSKISLQLARQLFCSLSNNDLEPSAIDPSAEGGVCISFREGPRYADFECFNDGELLAATSLGGDETDVWVVKDTNQDLNGTLDKLREFLGR